MYKDKKICKKYSDRNIRNKIQIQIRNRESDKVKICS